MSVARRPTEQLVADYLRDHPRASVEQTRRAIGRRKADVAKAVLAHRPAEAGTQSPATGAAPGNQVPSPQTGTLLDLVATLGRAGVVTPTSLRLDDPDPDFDQVEALARYLATLRDATAWWIGDLILYSEAVFGERAYQLAEATGRAPETLRRWAWVCERVPPVLRRTAVPFQHHQLVAKLPPEEQREWLDRCEAEGWSSRDLQARLGAIDAHPDDRAGPWRTSKSVEWYTPPHVIAAVRRVLGEIDLDPASCAAANETVRATRYYTADDDGLKQPWWGRVWLNPPYGGGAAAFSRRLLDEYEAGRVEAAILHVNAYSSDTAWYHRLLAHPTLIVLGRINFTGPNATPGNTCGSVFVYLGRDEPLFVSVFSQFGTPVTRLDVVPVDRLLDVPQKPKTPEWA